MAQLKIIFLGTSASIPTKLRGLSSVALLRGSELLLFDAGEGIQRALFASNLGFNRKTKIFITHLHGDHCIGLLGLLQTMSMLHRDKSVFIYGPSHLKPFLDCNINILGINPSFQIHLQEVNEGPILEDSEYVIKACRTYHMIESYAYCLEEKDRPGIFYPERVKEFGVPKGRLWSILQKGGSVVIDDRTVTPLDVLGPPRKGRKIGITGDTRPTSNLETFFKGCDVLIFDSTYGNDHADKAIENQHSTAREAAIVAQKAGAKTLILTHFSARYDDTAILVAEASEIHTKVKAAEDLMLVDVPYSD